MKRIVLIAGFESFNANLYRQAASMAMGRCEKLEIMVLAIATSRQILLR